MEALTSRSNWSLEVSVFFEGGKPENLEKNPWSKERTKNKLNPHKTAGTGIDPGSHGWDWGEPFPLRQPCSLDACLGYYMAVRRCGPVLLCLHGKHHCYFI